MSEAETSQTGRGPQERVIPFPSAARARQAPASQPPTPQAPAPQTSVPQVSFNRDELRTILNLYGRMVAAGEWRDYAIDFLRDRAVFSIYRRTSEVPLFRIVKDPSLARRQGAYAVMAPSGQILKRGQELARVLRVMETPLRVVKN